MVMSTVKGATVFVFLILFSLYGKPLWAIPTFQTYIDGGSAGTLGGDEDTWFVYTNSFTLYVVGAYGPKTQSIDGVTLLVSVPEGEIGTISFSTLDEPPLLLTTTGQGSTSEVNPIRDADKYVLSDVAGYSGYGTINTNTFLPDNLSLNNHYPLKDDIADFIIFELGSFSSDESNLYDYNAEDGTITPTGASGEQKEYDITFTGFSWVHFDVYGLVTDEKGSKIVSTWDNSPGSHDATAVPEPSTLLLLTTGFGMTVLFLRRKRLS